MALKARLEALERGKRKAEDDGEVARGYNAAGSGASNGKRFRQTQSAVMPSEPMPTAGNGRSKMGILERVQFGAQRSGSGNGKAHMGGAVHDARDDDPQQCAFISCHLIVEALTSVLLHAHHQNPCQAVHLYKLEYSMQVVASKWGYEAQAKASHRVSWWAGAEAAST